MASAKIGALHVSLGIDSASFTAGLAMAENSVAKLNRSTKAAFTAIAAAGVAAATALGFAVKGAIDHADAIGKASQKVGVAAESLSRLEYAAKLSDVSLEQLTGGLGRLSRSLADVAAGGQGPAATAFAALGIKVKDAAGQLRASDEVFAEVADRFSRMEDGSTKTALAMSLFGKTGAELIPMLNSGRAGLKAMADESDRFGQTISGEAARGAEEFNDTLTRVGAISSGVANQIMQGMLPSLQAMANKMASPEFQASAKSLGDAVGGMLNYIVVQAGNAVTALQGVGKQLDWMATHDLFGNRIADPKPGDQAYNRRRWGPGGAQNQLTDALKAGSMSAPDDAFFAGIFGPAAASGGAAETPIAPFIADLDAFKTATEAAGSAQQQLQQIMTEGQSVFTAMRTPIESLQAELDKLGQLLNKGAIDWETYERARRSAILNTAADELGALGQVSGALASAFKDNKAFALANAAINTAQGMTKALATEGFLGIASAAAVGIAGAAQMMSIASTNLGSAAAPASVSSGVAAPQVPQATAGRSTVINLHGTPNTPTTLGMVGGLLEQLQEELRIDGRELVIVHKGR